MQSTLKNKILRIIFISIIAFSISIATFHATSHAWFGEQALDDFVNCLKGECPEEQLTSFTQFTGGLEAPSIEGYAPGLVRETSLRDFIVNITNFILGFLGLIAVVIVIYGGFLYVTAAGEQDKAEKGKKAITYAVIGIILILGSFAIVNTLLQAPTGEDIGLRGTAEFGEGMAGTAGEVRFNNIAVQIERMARDIVVAHTFHFEAQKALNEAENSFENANLVLVTCSNGGCTGTTSSGTASSYVSAFSNNINAALTTLQNLRSRITSDIVAGSFIRETIDTEVMELNRIKNLIESRQSAIADTILSNMEVLEQSPIEGGDIAPAFKNAMADPYNTYLQNIRSMHEATRTAMDSNFQTIAENAVSDLKDIYDAVSPLTEAANSTMFSLVFEQQLKLGTCGTLFNAGLICELIEAVTQFEGDVPGPGDAAYDKLAETYDTLVELYNIIQNLQFVSVRLTASVVEGSAPLAVNFSSIGSIDPSGLTVEESQIRWDLDGDGNYNEGSLEADRFIDCYEGTGGDQSGATGPVTTSCIYKKPGTYRAKLKVYASSQNNPETDAAYNEEIGPGVSTIDILVNEPETKINLSIDNMLSDNKNIIQYNDEGFINIDRSSVIFPLSIASNQGVQFNATLTETKDGDAFSTQSEQGATVYWDFGDNSVDGINKTLLSATPGNLQQTHIYSEEGSYNVMVEFADKDRVVDRKIFTLVISSLVPQINISPMQAKIGQEITLDGGDSISDNGQITSYSWSFNPSVQGLTGLQDETIKYSFDTPNTYTATLTVTDPIKTEGVSTSEDFAVISDPPVAQFTYTIPDQTQPSTIMLEGSNSYDPDGEAQLNYLWEVNGSTLENNVLGDETEYSYNTTDPARPSVKFKNKDTFTVSLTVIDPNGGGQGVAQDSRPLDRDIEITNTIDIAWGDADDPTGNMVLNEVTGENEAQVTFTLVSDNAIAYEMDFGDGQVEQGEMTGSKSITHTYTEAGTFVVQAAVFDAEDEENNIKRKVFISSSDTPSAVIGVQVNGEEVFDLTEPLNLNRKDVITFDAGNSINTDGTGRRLTYSWDFGDGDRSTEKTANHTYDNVGDYQVTLKVVNENDVTQTSTDKIDITIMGEPPTMKSLTAAPVGTDLTAPVTVQLNAVGAEDPDGQITRYRWWYYDPSNDQDELGVQVTTGPTANVTIGTRGLEGEERTYKFGVEITDDENNTISSAEILAPSVVPELTVVNGPNQAPSASFTVDRTNIYVGEEVNFTSASVDPDGQIVAYFWDFEGDGFANNTTDEGPNVSHIFNTPATNGIRVRLKVRDNNESEATSQPVTIFVDSLAQPPVAAFTSEQADETTQVGFTDNSTADEINELEILKWNWDFDVNIDSNGDGKKDNDLDSTEQNPTYDYPDYGIYRTKLTVFDDQGQSSSVTNFVNVKTTIPTTTTPTTAPTTTRPAATLDARLVSQPPASISDGKIHLKGETGNITFDYSTSVGDIATYTMDKNIYFDTDGNGVNDDDKDHTATTPGKWTTDFAKEWGAIRVKLTVTDKSGNKDTIEKDVVFDEASQTAANVLDKSNDDILAVLVSILGFGIIILTLRKVLKTR